MIVVLLVLADALVAERLLEPVVLIVELLAVVVELVEFFPRSHSRPVDAWSTEGLEFRHR